MKIGQNKYQCPWCMTVINHKRNSVLADNNPQTNTPGRHTVTAPLTCPKCGRIVSQRTKEGFR